MAEGIQKRLQTEVEKFQGIQKDFNRTAKARQQLEAQLTENTIVKQELDLLNDESEARVFKLIGPVLVKQQLSEAKQNVEKRLEYITGEIKRHEGTLADLEKKRESQSEVLKKLQQQLQSAQVKLAMKA